MSSILLSNDTISYSEDYPMIDSKESFRINHPSVLEVENAGNIFKNEMQELIQSGVSINVAIKSAAARVWSAARKYQAERDTTRRK